MRKLAIILVALVATLAFTASANATNSHQDHQGACARSTTSISKGLGDLKFNGVLGKFARAFGIKSFDGNLTKQLKNRLTVGTVVSATKTNNHGCDGNSHVFGVGKRTLYKGEKVIVKVPAKYGKDVCVGSHRGCKAVTITVNVALPSSCWNLNPGTVRVKIWIRAHKKHKKHPKHPSKPVCDNGSPMSNGFCDITQTNKAEQNCKDSGGTWDSVKQQCTIIQNNGVCSNTVIVNGTGNVVNSSQGGNCNPGSNNPPPPPPPAASATCDMLSVIQDPSVNLGISAHVDYSVNGGATLSSVTFSWGDNTTTTVNGQDASHVYSAGGNFIVNATLTFTSPSGDLTTTCSAQQITPKDGTTGAGSTTGGTAGGSGSGGTAGSGTGSVCRDPNTGDIRPGNADQFGYCVA